MRKIPKIICAVFGMFVLCTLGAAAHPLENKNAIGLRVLGGGSNYGGACVGGIQYERRFSEIISMKFDVFGYATPDKSYSENAAVSVSSEIDFKLYQARWGEHCGSRLFAYILGGYNGVSNVSYTDGNSDTYAAKWSSSLIGSAGVGMEFLLADHISIPIQIGFIGALIDNPCASMCGGIAMRYSW